MQVGSADPVVHTVRLPQLPLCSLLFLSDKALCGAGHDFNPVIFTTNAGKSPILLAFHQPFLCPFCFHTDFRCILPFPLALAHLNPAGSWSIFGNLDKEESRAQASPAAGSGGVSAARELFRNKTVRGQDLKNDTDTLRTVHERAVTLLQDATPPGAASKAGTVTRVSSSSLDGRLVVWDLPALDIDMATLGL